MEKTIISVDGLEVFSEASVEVEAGRENKVLETKMFSGSTFDEIKGDVDKYVQYLRKKYHPAIVRSNLPRKGATMNILRALVKIANDLDSKGQYDLAQEVDCVIKMAASHSGLIRALKEDDNGAVREALADFIRSLPWGSTPDKELRMTPEEYKDFVTAIKSGRLDKAREIFKVEMGDVEWEKVRSKTKEIFEGDVESDSKQDDKCDRCGGRGVIPNPRVSGPADMWYLDCPSCGGRGIKK